MTDKAAYTVAEASHAFTRSIDELRAAIKSGDLPAWRPIVNGRPSKTFSILHDDLVAWVRNGQPANHSP